MGAQISIKRWNRIGVQGFSEFGHMTSTLRAQERVRKIIKTTWSGLFARIISIGVSLLMVPLAVHYLGKEQYGLWVAVSSLVAMLAFLDGGAGNAVINMVAHASGAKKDNLAKIVSTAFFGLMALALVGCLLFLAAFPFITWRKLLGISESTSLADLNIVVIIVGLFFFISIFTTLVGKIQRGLQEGNLDNFWNGIGALLSLLFVYIAIQKDAGLVGFVIAFLAGSLFACLASNVHYLFFYRRDLRPRLENVNGAVAKNLFTVGGMFFLLQIAGAIQGQADNVIIANMLGPAAVTNYAISMKLSLMVPMLFSLILTPLWPAYREAFSSGDMQWVRHVFAKSIRWALLISIPSAFVLVMLGGKLIEIWVGQEVVPSTGLLVGCGIWMVFCTVGSALAMLLNGLQIIKVQIITSAIAAAVNVALSIYLIAQYGPLGAVYGSIISWFFCTLIPCSITVHKALKHN
jgi:O-antigen/teichoic acid export membrane protein